MSNEVAQQVELSSEGPEYDGIAGGSQIAPSLYGQSSKKVLQIQKQEVDEHALIMLKFAASMI